MRRKRKINAKALFKSTFGFSPKSNISIQKAPTEKSRVVTLKGTGADCLKAANEVSPVGKQVTMKGKKITIKDVRYNVKEGEIKVTFR